MQRQWYKRFDRDFSDFLPQKIQGDEPKDTKREMNPCRDLSGKGQASIEEGRIFTKEAPKFERKQVIL